jgi:predicted metal-dependent HD superfamily phosphohydrolase
MSMFDETPLVEKTRLFAENILQHLPTQLVYHDLTHTRRVVKYAEEIGTNMALTSAQMEVLMVAAWTHDIGYSQGFDHHEERSKSLAEPFLMEQNAPNHLIERVLQCIDATKVPQFARIPEAMVLADADLAHLAADDCMQTSEQLRSELSAIYGLIEPLRWYKSSADFFRNHHYITLYGQQVLAPHKQKNYEELLLAITTLEASVAP